MSPKVTSEMVKDLRERTGVGMSKCKEALDKAGGDMESAIDILRKAGMASAVKKEGRETNEGSIGTAEGKTVYALVEVNAETDFVVKSD
ncbi:MAG TPA: elongation factor Ts, partial [Rhabdochlamydiaceae bacterium]|nr:elongation factor Ts [Rhabdochlamydiaceae bacterium]